MVKGVSGRMLACTRISDTDKSDFAWLRKKLNLSFLAFRKLEEKSYSARDTATVCGLVELIIFDKFRQRGSQLFIYNISS